MFKGMFLGLAAALCQSLFYMFSATFSRRFSVSALEQFLLNHLAIGALSLACLPWVWDDQILAISTYIMPLLGAMLTYLAGQVGIYSALRHSPASRVSPLLGIKVMLIALIGALWLDQSYTPLQWAGIGCCIVGACWLSLSGGRIASPALGWVFVSCFSFALSDIFILELIGRFDHLERLAAAGLSVTLCYLFCGAVALCSWRSIRQPQLLWYSLPTAISWFLAIACLFGCFAYIGTVFGGVMQSSRGVMSILLGVSMAYAGWRYAEPLPSGAVFMQRLSAAGLMLAAIALFSLGTAL